MFVVTCPMRDDRLALTLETAGRYDGFRAISSPVVHDAVESMFSRMYGKPIPLAPGRAALAPGGRYFAEDN
jgi:hypothetical protein